MEEHPTGFRFCPPGEEELSSFYLHDQLHGGVIPVLYIYDPEPWNLPKLAGELCRRDREQWFFFATMQEREAKGGRPNRSMATGYWKATRFHGYVWLPQEESPSGNQTSTGPLNSHQSIPDPQPVIFSFRR